jgi:hypothetical protein
MFTNFGWFNSQDSKTQTTSNSDLLLSFHVEIPDNEPWKGCESEIGSDEPGCAKAN